jgi:hypothetical protein
VLWENAFPSIDRKVVLRVVDEGRRARLSFNLIRNWCYIDSQPRNRVATGQIVGNSYLMSNGRFAGDS